MSNFLFTKQAPWRKIRTSATDDGNTLAAATQRTWTYARDTLGLRGQEAANPG